ncbi:MAG: NifB/NifX family molybdenum-iron cluster-binding protein [Pseudomonadota bacterium]
MKAGFAAWENRVAPVFDVAREIILMETENGQVVGRRSESLAETEPMERARRLEALGVEILVCGAISRFVEEVIASRGIRVISFVAGELPEVIRAWLEDGLDDGRFAMPGSLGRRWGGTGGKHRAGGPVAADPGQPGCGAGSGRRGRGGGRIDRSGYCECPRCGLREPHERGLPCVERLCPRCGVALARV